MLTRRLEAESGESRELLASPDDNAICCISIESDVPCLKVVWRRYATSLQLRYIHERLLELLQRHRLSKILGDNTALPTIHAHDQRWLTEQWLPRASAAGLRSAASKRPDSQFALVAIQSVQSAQGIGIEFGSFADVDSARRWLAGQ